MSEQVIAIFIKSWDYPFFEFALPPSNFSGSCIALRGLVL